jgi:hypothetical protein
LEVEEVMLVADAMSLENEATAIATDSRMTSELLPQDLKALVEDNWDWHVRRLSDTDFTVVFPTKASLNLCKNLCRNAGGISLPVSKISVLFADPLPHLRASAVLSEVWVHMSDVPPCLRRAELLLEGNKMLGRPRIVDDESLAAKEGPMRMLFHSQAPDHLPKYVMLFANLQGFKIGVSVESSKGEGSKLAGPVDVSKDDKDDEGNEGERTEEQSLSDCHWKQRNSKDKETTKDTGGSGGQRGAPKVAAPMAASTPPPTLPTPSLAPPVQPVKFQKKLLKKPGTKSSVGSSSVPPPSAKDH